MTQHVRGDRSTERFGPGVANDPTRLPVREVTASAPLEHGCLAVIRAPAERSELVDDPRWNPDRTRPCPLPYDVHDAGSDIDPPKPHGFSYAKATVVEQPNERPIATRCSLADHLLDVILGQDSFVKAPWDARRADHLADVLLDRPDP